MENEREPVAGPKRRVFSGIVLLLFYVLIVISVIFAVYKLEFFVNGDTNINSLTNAVVEKYRGK